MSPPACLTETQTGTGGEGRKWETLARIATPQSCAAAPGVLLRHGPEGRRPGAKPGVERGHVRELARERSALCVPFSLGSVRSHTGALCTYAGGVT